jgi:hypothetical protein
MSERLTQVTIIRDLRSPWDYKPGEIGKPDKPFQQSGEAHWFIACPGCGGHLDLSMWGVTEHEDGTLSIAPSIQCFGAEKPCNAHYFVVRNQIRWM